jgi:hypothetical protein
LPVGNNAICRLGFHAIGAGADFRLMKGLILIPFLSQVAMELLLSKETFRSSRRPGSKHQSADSNGLGNRVRSARGAELGEERCDMEFRGVQRDAQPSRDGLVGFTFRQ